MMASELLKRQIVVAEKAEGAGNTEKDSQIQETQTIRLHEQSFTPLLVEG